MSLSFLVPAFLAGLAALALPIWVHLRNRRRSEQVEFPSLMFLRRIPTRSIRRRELRYRALFALRCLALALLAVAFARPFLAGDELGALGAPTARERVVLVDRSWSMGYGDRWERAREAVAEAMAATGPDDRVSLVLFDEEAEVPVEHGGDPGAVTAAMAAVEPGEATTRFSAGLRVAQRILSESELPDREILLVSDYQQVGWEEAEALDMPEGTRLTAVDLSTESATNLSVADVALRRRAGDDNGDDLLAVSARLTRQATAADAGPESSQVEAELHIDGQVVQRAATELPRNGAATVSFEPVPLTAAPMRGSVQTAPDALPGDNRMHFVVTSGQALAVLVLESPAASETDSLYLRRALEIGSRPSFQVQRRSIRGVDSATLEGRSLVILNDAGVPSESTASALRRWVGAGGGLWVALGELSSDDGWPRAARELLPTGFGTPVDRSDELGATLAHLDLDHPALELFATPGSGDFGAARFYRYRPLQPRPTEGVLGRFDDGAVALVEHRVGAGRVLVWASTLDTFWNDLPLQPIYLPLIHSLARYTAGYVEPAPWFRTGRALSAATLLSGRGLADDAGPAALGQLQIVSPEGSTQTLAPSGSDTGVRLQAGFSTLRWEGGSTVVAANLDRRESDLASIDPEELAAAVAWQSGEVPQQAGDAVVTPESMERRQSLWWYLLVVAFALLAAETALSNRLSRHAS